MQLVDFAESKARSAFSVVITGETVPSAKGLEHE